MGACFSSSASMEGNLLDRSHAIEKGLKMDEQQAKKIYKLLLLGAGESGKSTILKQMRQLHNQPFSPTELAGFRDLMYQNIIQAFGLILDCMEEWGLEVSAPNSAAEKTVRRASEAFRSNHDLAAFPLELKQPLLDLWEDPGVKAACKRGKERCFPENLPYLMERSNVDRFWTQGYLPSSQDVLRTRAKTVGVLETVFRIGQNTMNVIDVGGQRSERRKWIHVFSEVSALVFVVSLAGYDTCLVEDETANQMQESLLLFSSISNSPHFRKSALLLFLNKCDLFQEKVRARDSPVKSYFPDYDGPEGDVKAATAFFAQKFLRLFRRRSQTGRDGDGGMGMGVEGRSGAEGGLKEVYVHETTAVDPEIMRFTMRATTDIILRQRLADVGLF